MAGEWIKCRLGLATNRRVLEMSEKLESLAGVPGAFRVDVVVSRLLEVWGYVRLHGQGDLLPSSSISSIDRVAMLPGMGDAMRSVGWLEVSSEGVRFPNFTEWNSPKSAAERQAKSRNNASKSENRDGFRDNCVTEAQQQRNGRVTVALPEEEEEREREKDLSTSDVDVEISKVADRANRIGRDLGLSENRKSDRSLVWKTSWLVETHLVSESELATVLEGVRRQCPKKPAAYFYQAMRMRLCERSRSPPAKFDSLLKRAPEPPEDGPWTETKP